MTLLAGASGNASWLRQGRSLQVVSYVPSSPQARQRGREGTQGLTAFPVGSRAACVQSTSQIGKENKTFTFVQSSPPANQVSCSTFVLRWLKEKSAKHKLIYLPTEENRDLVGRSAAAPQPQAWAAQGGGSPLPSTRWVWTRLPGDKVSFCWPKLCSPSTPLPLPMVGHPTLPDPAERGVSPSPRLRL